MNYKIIQTDLSDKSVRSLQSAMNAGSGAEIKITGPMLQGDRYPLILTNRQYNKYVEKIQKGQGMTVKISAKNLEKLKKINRTMGGALPVAAIMEGIDIAKDVGKAIADEVDPSGETSELIDTASNPVGAVKMLIDKVGELIEDSQKDWDQMAKNEKMVINNAKTFLTLSRDAQMKKWNQVKNAGIMRNKSFEEFVDMNEDLASRTPRTAKQIKSTVKGRGMQEIIDLYENVKKKTM